MFLLDWRALAVSLGCIEFPGAYALIGQFAFGLGGLLAIVYAAAFVGADWNWGVSAQRRRARRESRRRTCSPRPRRWRSCSASRMLIIFAVGIVMTYVLGFLVGIPVANPLRGRRHLRTSSSGSCLGSRSCSSARHSAWRWPCSAQPARRRGGRHRAVPRRSRCYHQILTLVSRQLRASTTGSARLRADRSGVVPVPADQHRWQRSERTAGRGIHAGRWLGRARRALPAARAVRDRLACGLHLSRRIASVIAVLALATPGDHVTADQDAGPPSHSMC